MKVYEALARAFAAEGTTAVFGMMGDANMYWMNELDRLGVQLFEARHEGGALAMADGWGRTDGAPGVATTTSGPGVAQLATTLLVASRARTPLVAFVGEAPSGDDSYVQRLDQGRFAEACESGFVHLTTPDNAYEAVQQAFYRAKTESRPILLSAPMDIQQKPFDDEEVYVPSADLLNADPVFPNPVSIAKAADVLANSERPVLIVGRGAQRSGAGPAILELAESTGAIISTTLMAKTWLNEDDFHVGISGLYSTKTAMELFQEADAVIAVGAGLNKYTTEHGYLYPGAKFIHIDSKPQVVMGDGRSADVYVQSDAKAGITELKRVLDERGVRQSGYRTPDVKERLVTAFEDKQHYDLEPDTVDPRDVCRILDEQIPAEVGLVIGGGQNICFSTILMTKQRRMILMNQHFGCIGQGLTTAMGAMVATENKPTFLMEGDAGFMMHLPEFETAVRYGLPLLVVIMNDQLLGAEYHKAVAKGLNADLARVTTPNLGDVGRALGGRGALVTKIEDLAPAVAEYLADPVATIIDVRISTSVISIPYRRLHFGQDA
ncbi:acetolactate synthase [Streptomyces sp. AcH 505]|uniref:thiamine pyrophosphate-binding protein n=1 Tax=unclassified Streptomyces TaxID=2593676 RepID=UPI000591BEF3|nr:thiamine pyrophosphate-binding protein [Streptomyces sp. NBC_00370]KIF69851.1 acetolactate synthase [Streptomyces sp. AcH 505]